MVNGGVASGDSSQSSHHTDSDKVQQPDSAPAAAAPDSQDKSQSDTKTEEPASSEEPSTEAKDLTETPGQNQAKPETVEVIPSTSVSDSVPKSEDKKEETANEEKMDTGEPVAAEPEVVQIPGLGDLDQLPESSNTEENKKEDETKETKGEDEVKDEKEAEAGSEVPEVPEVSISVCSLTLKNLS